MTIDHSNWSRDPDDWPHTPPLEVYRELEREDSGLFWVMGAGHAANLLEEAIDLLDTHDRGGQGAINYNRDRDAIRDILQGDELTVVGEANGVHDYWDGVLHHEDVEAITEAIIAYIKDRDRQ